MVQELAQPEEDILDRYRIDAVDIGRAFNTRGRGLVRHHPGGPAPAGPVQYPSWFRPVHIRTAFGRRSRDGTRIATMPIGATFFDQT